MFGFRLPFCIWPASWGLRGRAYDEAKAYYELDGEELDRKLAEIQLSEDPKALARKNLDLDLKYRCIDDYTHATKMIEMDTDDLNEQVIRRADVDLRFGKISDYDAAVRKINASHEDGLEKDLALLDAKFDAGQMEKSKYEKQRATLNDEPWVAFVDSGFDPDQGLDGFQFELDWNPQWIEFLKLNGFVGHTDEQVVEDWFTELCRSNANLDSNVTVLGSLNGRTPPMGFDDRQ